MGGLSEQQGDVPTSQVVAAAVAKAVEETASAIDARFMLGLIVSILLLLFNLDLRSDQDAVTEAHAINAEASSGSIQRMIEALSTRRVGRSAVLRIGPDPSARTIMRLPANATVLVLEWELRWVKVRVLTIGEDVGSSAEIGWIPANRLARIVQVSETTDPDVESREINRNQEWFRSSMNTLRREYEGRYVAVWQSEVVDVDQDLPLLIARFAKRWGQGRAYFGFVGEQTAVNVASLANPGE